MIDFTLAELLTGLDLSEDPVKLPSEKPVRPPDESSVSTDEAEAEKPERKNP
jgi:hypothetical protein